MTGPAGAAATAPGDTASLDVAGLHVEVAVVGAGFAGLGMAVALTRAGIRDFVVLERADDVGGTWRDNTFPGAACDVPSHLYSFSFAPNPDWSRSFSGQAEILAYLRDCTDRFGLRPRIRFGHEVRAATFDEATGRWELSTSGGPVSARWLVAGMGPLAEPAVPDLPGLADFAGPVWHSARWRHDVDLAGRRVAVVGTGASAVQFIPAVAAAAAHLDVYQRTPPWVLPRRDRPLRSVEHRLFRRLPAAQLAVRAGIYWGRELLWLGFTSASQGRNPAEHQARRHLAAQVPDADLRARLTPDYAIGCKRILLSDDYYPALGRPGVTVVPGGATRVTPTGVVAADGVERPAGVIILGTGFRATDPPVASVVTGRGSTRLRDAWADGMAAYKGTTVAGFPNLFLLVGPNTGLGHNSIVYIIESQIPYVVAAIRAARVRGAATVEVRGDAQAAWGRRLADRLARTVWSTGGCDSWYLDGAGRNTTLWPGFSFRFRSALRRFDPEAYVFAPPPGTAGPSPGAARPA